MDSSLLAEMGILINTPEASSSAYLLESGLRYVHQGLYLEGLSVFARAREDFSTNEAQLVILLDAFKHSHETYSQAQEELFQASKHFVQADAELRVQIAALDRLLSSMPIERVEGNGIPANANELLCNVDGNQPLHMPHSSSEDSKSNQLSMQIPQRNLEDKSISQSQSPSPCEETASLPSLYVTCFGRFEVRRLGKPVALCSSRNGQMILRYLVARPGHSATIDTLMTTLWPEDEPEVAQPKLHIAISALRRSLNHGYICEPGSGYIICKNRTYYLNPAVVVRTDVDEFLQCYQAGRQTSEGRIALYERACLLYKGSFLSEDIYADWASLQREQLSQIYLAMCRVLTDHFIENESYEDAAKWVNATLNVNHYDEVAHRQLIQIYTTQGRRAEALQQYRRCERVLREELGVRPLPETLLVFQKLLSSEPPH